MREAGTMLGRFAQIRWLRPGSGWYNDAMLDAIEREGYRCALGSVYPYDGHGMPARVSSAYILANVAPGAVIILHEGQRRGARTATVLASVLPMLRARGYQVVTLSELHARSSRGRAGASP
jgi:peptidoglycan/xylan/chitin deacetylase (PgdA/CDA1 family)